MRTALVVTYNYPPNAAGVHRVLGLVRSMPRFGWRPIVVTAGGGPRFRAEDTALVEEPYVMDTPALRVPELRFGALEDAVPKLGPLLRQLLGLALPDGQAAWAFSAVAAANGILADLHVDAVFSTAPPRSAHLAGLLLARRTHAPWVCDFRDAMVLEPDDFGTARERVKRPLHCVYERLFVAHAARVVHVTQPALYDAQRRAPPRHRAKFRHIPNGYDEAAFAGLSPYRRGDRCVLSYTGSLLSKRTPLYFARALDVLDARRPELLELLEVRLAGNRTAREEEHLARWVARGVVVAEPQIAYRASLQRQVSADVNLLFNTISAEENGHLQVSGKLYEYLRAGRPILAMAPRGPVHELVTMFDAGVAVTFDDVDAVAAALESFVEAWRVGALPPSRVAPGVARFERGELTGEICALLDDAVAEGRRARSASALRSTKDDAGAHGGANARGPRDVLRRMRTEAKRLAKRTRYQCPLCAYRGAFDDVDTGARRRTDARCPRCGSLERHRLTWLALDAWLRDRGGGGGAAGGGRASLAVLHFAPEPCLSTLLRARFDRYVKSDIAGGGVDVRADLRRLPFHDGAFDIVVACHVLEHIRDDRAAMREVRRVLAHGGAALLPVPTFGPRTIEYPAPNPAEHFHVRAPGVDYEDRLRAEFAGVDVVTSDDVPPIFQTHLLEDRSRRSRRAPLRPTEPGTVHLERVPICFTTTAAAAAAATIDDARRS